MEPKQAMNAVAQQQAQQGIGAESAVGQHQVPGFKLVHESLQEA
jgi:hypothetical protein